MPYATPTEFWKLAAPPDSLFEEQAFECGAVGAVTHVGAGLGSLVVSPTSDPRDAWTVVVKCVRAGELNSNYVNPGAEPQFRISYNGGASYWWQTFSPDAAGQLKIVKGGFTLVLANGSAGAPVTIGLTNASLIFTPKRAGGSVKIVVSASLTHTFFNGALVLTVTNTTTATQAAAYLAGHSAVVDYFAAAAGGTGAGYVLAAALTPLPFASFVADETWSFTTQPSIDVVAAQEVAQDLMAGYFRGTLSLPITDIGAYIKQVESELARWHLIKRRGLDKDQDFKVYAPIEAMKWLENVQAGHIMPTTQEDGARSFPLLTPAIDPLSEEAGAFPI